MIIITLWSLLGSLALVADIRELEYPEYFPLPAYDLAQSPLIEAKVTLGRALFYDPILSKDSSISCASCHSHGCCVPARPH
ncbi:MAG: cytochrome c peroxidase, partial [Bacteroidota bacterium]